MWTKIPALAKGNRYLFGIYLYDKEKPYKFLLFNYFKLNLKPLFHKDNPKTQIRNFNVDKRAETLVQLTMPKYSNLSQSQLELIISSVYM